MMPFDCDSWSLRVALPVVSPGKPPLWHSGASKDGLGGGAGACDCATPWNEVANTAPAATAITLNIRMGLPSMVDSNGQTFE
jgi:hypothetical protein